MRQLLKLPSKCDDHFFNIIIIIIIIIIITNFRIKFDATHNNSTEDECDQTLNDKK